MLLLLQKILPTKSICGLLCGIFIASFSCDKKTEIETILISNKKNPCAWALVDIDHGKIDTLDLLYVIIFKEDNLLEDFMMEDGKRRYPLYIDEEPNYDKEMWRYYEKINFLTIGMSIYEVINCTKDTVLVRPLCSENRKILVKLPIKV